MVSETTLSSKMNLEPSSSLQMHRNLGYLSLALEAGGAGRHSGMLVGPQASWGRGRGGFHCSDINYSHEATLLHWGTRLLSIYSVHLIVYLGNFLFIGKIRKMATSKARKLKSLSKLAKRDGDSCTIRVLVALNVRSHWVMIAFRAPSHFPGPVNHNWLSFILDHFLCPFSEGLLFQTSSQ